MNKKIIYRIVIVLVIVTLVVLFNHYQLGDYLTLEFIKENQEKFKGFYKANKLVTLLAYFGVYVVITGIALPGAAIMTVLAGALFGFGIGTFLVSFASALGASVSFLISRFLFQGFFRKKFSKVLDKINQGILSEGKFYLFSLRLIPVFPFFVINVVMGLTKMDLKSFYWVSQLGMLLGTMVFVNAGSELATISQISDILSPNILISFVLIGIFPLVAKKLIKILKKKKES